MPKLTVGATLPDFTFDTPFAQGRTMAQTAAAVQGKTALVFLRYYGCTLCQYDIHQFLVEHAKIAGQQGPEALPFDIICDPEQKLYKEFDIRPAKSKLGMVNLKTIGKLSKAKAFTHGEYEGDELQLPAVFVVTPDMKLTHVHYGTAAGDVPTPEELAELLK